MSTNEEAEKALRISLKSLKDFGDDTESNRNGAVARNVLHEEIGYFGEYGRDYQLSQETKDVLLAHGRQDAAHALSNTISILKEIQTVKRYLRNILALLLIAMVAVAYFAFSR